MHAKADVKTHGFESLLPSLPIDYIVAHVKTVFQTFEGFRGYDLGKPRVSRFMIGRTVEVALRMLRMIFRSVGECIESLRTRFEACLRV